MCRREGVVCRREGVVCRREGVVCRREGVVCRREGVVCRREGVREGGVCRAGCRVDIGPEGFITRPGYVMSVSSPVHLHPHHVPGCSGDAG